MIKGKRVGFTLAVFVLAGLAAANWAANEDITNRVFWRG